jgi:hypothetical protein
MSLVHSLHELPHGRGLGSRMSPELFASGHCGQSGNAGHDLTLLGDGQISQWHKHAEQ